jgi:hypothetical protein
MILTPVRWVVMVGIAACGYFLITSPSMYVRGGAFVGSLVCWQLHGILMVADGYALMQIQKAKAKENESMLSLEAICTTLKQDYNFSDAELEVLLRKLRGVNYVENNPAISGQQKPDAVASTVR